MIRRTEQSLQRVADEIEKYGYAGAAMRLGITRETVRRYGRLFKQVVGRSFTVPDAPAPSPVGAKILMIDIETAPGIVRTHSYFKTTYGASMVVRHPFMLCWAAKWYGQDGILFDRISDAGGDDRKISASLSEIVASADMIVAHNGRAFDVAFLSARLCAHGLPPIRPVRVYDTYRAARSCFKFAHNSLEGIARTLGIGSKLPHRGDEMWKGCEAGDLTSWGEMEEYNVHYVVLLEGVYTRLRTFDPRHPNLALFWPDDGSIRCPRCQAAGSMKEDVRGCTTNLSVFPLFRCEGCGAWLRSGVREEREAVLRGVL